MEGLISNKKKDRKILQHMKIIFISIYIFKVLFKSKILLNKVQI